MYKLIAFLFILCSVAASYALQAPINFATKPEDTGSAEAVFRELQEEVSLWSEEVEKTRKMVGDYKIHCVDLIVDLAVSMLGPGMSLFIPVYNIIQNILDYLNCTVIHGSLHPQCISQLKTLVELFMDLPNYFRNFFKLYVRFLKDIPVAFTACIHFME